MIQENIQSSMRTNDALTGGLKVKSAQISHLNILANMHSWSSPILSGTNVKWNSESPRPEAMSLATKVQQIMLSFTIKISFEISWHVFSG
jgi:hypothetical protein